eukprot:TRINITY_DN7018_c0_g1_i1.p1 TRINITY_DN7018_c0_g1~~TRINITY_DN7018_c0_g1_i1.p1  ORF type:complete len:314 (-),score=57.71 TRINITY_DN7018_c0_g1_i1:92-946(-)
MKVRKASGNDSTKIALVLEHRDVPNNNSNNNTKNAQSGKGAEAEPYFLILFKAQAAQLEWFTMFNDHTEIFKEAQMKIFGRPLAEVLAKEKSNENVPQIVLKTTKALEKEFDTEGLFRKAPPRTQFDEIKAKLDKDIDSVDMGGLNAHLIAALLKSYLRELPEGVLTFRFFEDVIMNADLTDKIEQEDIAVLMEPLSNSLKLLPVGHQAVLTHMISFLRTVASHADKNKMTAYNLSIVFGPTLLRPREESIETTLKSPSVNSVVRMLIETPELLSSLISSKWEI